MMYAYYPPSGGGVAIYPTFADFPATATTGSLAVDASTGDLFEFNGTMWVLIASPSGAPGANRTLSNLLPTAVNQSLVPTSDASSDLGTGTNRWGALYVGSLNDVAGNVSYDPQNRRITDSSGVVSIQGNLRTLVTAANSTILSWAGPNLTFTDGSQGTAGYVWTSIDTLGNGTWLPATGGGVTSVGLADSTGLFTITGSPVTSSGTLTLASLNSQSANNVLAAPNGSAGAPTFRTLVGADVSGFTTGSVLFANSSGQIGQNNADLFWDNSNFFLGIGTATPNNKLRIAGTPRSDGTLTSTFDTSATGSNTTFGGIKFESSPGVDFIWGKYNVNSSVFAQLRTSNGVGAGLGTILMTVTTVGALTLPNYSFGALLSDGSGNITSVPGSTGQVLTSNGASATPTWQTPAASGANTALSNLTTTAINQSLVPGVGSFNLGSLSLNWNFLYASSVAATNYYGGTGSNTSLAEFGSPILMYESSADPVSVTPAAGEVYYNSTSNLLRFYNGTAWENISGPGMIDSLGTTIDGGGSVITTGLKGFISVPYSCTINSVVMLADQTGSVVVDIWKTPYASFPPTITNSITASDQPTISSAQKSQDTTLTGWTTTVNAGDTIAFNVNSASSITRLNLILKVTRT